MRVPLTSQPILPRPATVRYGSGAATQSQRPWFGHGHGGSPETRRRINWRQQLVFCRWQMRGPCAGAASESKFNLNLARDRSRVCRLRGGWGHSPH
jgi:hypothetical protein